MLIRILGSAAGGGFPQWNCNCGNCRGVRDGTLDARSRTQSSIAVSSDAERWVLFNASPDLHRQIQANPQLQPRRAVRDTPIAAVVLADGQIDHAAGLLLMREHTGPLQVYATAAVHQDLTTSARMGRRVHEILVKISKMKKLGTSACPRITGCFEQDTLRLIELAQVLDD